ncbi:hypothetical protein FF2_028195 [Malus domestica]
MTNLTLTTTVAVMALDTIMATKRRNLVLDIAIRDCVLADLKKSKDDNSKLLKARKFTAFEGDCKIANNGPSLSCYKASYNHIELSLLMEQSTADVKARQLCMVTGDGSSGTNRESTNT